jgi:hypothetical protein
MCNNFLGTVASFNYLGTLAFHKLTKYIIKMGAQNRGITYFLASSRLKFYLLPLRGNHAAKNIYSFPTTRPWPLLLSCAHH